MGRADLVVPVGADDKEVANVGVGDEMLKQFESGRVQPLQVIKKERERMLFAGEHTEEGPEHRLEPVLRIQRRELRHRRLLAYYELELVDKVY
jgi:hypothetical protein